MVFRIFDPFLSAVHPARIHRYTQEKILRICGVDVCCHLGGLHHPRYSQRAIFRIAVSPSDAPGEILPSQVDLLPGGSGDLHGGAGRLPDSWSFRRRADRGLGLGGDHPVFLDFRQHADSIGRGVVDERGVSSADALDLPGAVRHALDG